MDLVAERMGCLEGRKESWDCQDSGFGDCWHHPPRLDIQKRGTLRLRCCWGLLVSEWRREEQHSLGNHRHVPKAWEINSQEPMELAERAEERDTATVR